jgi:iron complex outermembrane recepter protein
MLRVLTCLLLSLPSSLLAQSLDSTRQLADVTVVGYATNRSLLQTGASVGLLTRRDLQQRFAGTPTLVPALNTLPGVRMDERSPGSYRLSIRGSLLRSPFGVRNVKVYWQDLPLTDAGGNTPLNALDVRAIGRVEVIKGPGGSLYGAGTGGTILFSGPTITAGQTQVEATTLAGSYGLLGYGVGLQIGRGGAAISLSYNHLQSSGYRNHSALVRDNLQLSGTVQVGNHQSLSVLGLYSDLAYQTPGGLTEAQFRADPSASRPATRTLPGSSEQGAGIYQRYAYLGLSHEIRADDWLRHTTAMYTTTTDFRNPFITNYERRADQGLGGRVVTQVTPGRAKLGAFAPTGTIGGEFQRTFVGDRNYGNRRGQIDTLQTDDELRANVGAVFVQVEQPLPWQMRATLGLSRNLVNYGFTRFSRQTTQPGQEQARTFAPVWLPRVSLLKQFGETVSAFMSVGAGYSAPTTAEVLSSTGQFNPTLEPESGTNVELGVRGQILDRRLRFDLVAYSFQLDNTITRRSAENGAEFFVNAGRTNQPGFEAQLHYQPFGNAAATPSTVHRSPFTFFQIWHSLSLTDYRFRNYVQTTNDFSGNRVTGFGVDAETGRVGRGGFYCHLTFSFLNPFPLNDANTATADPTRILTATLGYRHALLKHYALDAFVTGDNLLDQSYSLGYDLNAVGGRFYNAAARRGFSFGIRVLMRNE